MSRRFNLRGTTNHFWSGVTLVLCLIALDALVFCGTQLVRQHRYERRGILDTELPALPVPCGNGYGVNAWLEQYTSDEDLRRALSLVDAGGFSCVRQRFPWAEIEPSPGEYRWEPWDRLVSQATQHGLHLIAVLDTSPEWARSRADQNNHLAPPQFVTTFGLFARAFAERYGDAITFYQVWDQPNVYPHWGARPIDPAAYVRLLKVAAAELRRADAETIVLSAGLAPTTETGGRNMSEVLFLDGVYQAGGKGLFDVLAAKPYGFWSGPEDRRVNAGVLNFSRLILLREAMVRFGDGDTPIWAVEFGWNSLPEDWPGHSSPWGTDDAAKQADRTARAVRRAREEWPWLGLLCWAQLQPDVPKDDPLWGFALLGPDGEPRPLYTTLQATISTPMARIQPDDSAYYQQLALLAAGAVVTIIALVRLWPLFPWRDWVKNLTAVYLATPEWAQWALPCAALAMYYWVPWAVPALVMLAVASALFYLRLDIGLACLAFSIPFFLYPKILFGKSSSLVETLTLVCAAVWFCREVFSAGRRAVKGNLARLFGAWRRSLTSLDWAVVAFVGLAALSLWVSANRSVSIREFRLVVVEPVLFYFILRQARLDETQLLRLADAIVLAGVAVSALGLYQFFVSGDVIVAEGVRRVRGVYGSPNNLSLFLDRVVPLTVSVWVVGRSRRRWVYGLALVSLLLCFVLTFSRGGWLLGLPAVLLTVGALRGRRTALMIVAALLIGGLALLPLVGTERLISVFDLEQGTAFLRVKLWRASLDMIRDYPVTGVGLDNFLTHYPDYMLREAWEEPDLSHPHNVILEWWTRLGIVGVVVLLWLLVVFFRRALYLYRRLPDGDGRAIILACLAGMVGALAHGQIDNFYFVVDLAFLFFFSLGWIRAATAGSVLEAR